MIDDRLSEDAIIQRGLTAEAILRSDEYNDMYDLIARDIADEILATPLNDEDYRNQLYITYNGMRAFSQRLVAYATAKKSIEDKRNAEQDIEQDIDF